MIAARNHGLLSSSATDRFVEVARRVDLSAPWSVGHSQRVAAVAAAIATAAKWAPADIARLHRAAELHDVGKLCVADEVLCHPGPLDAAARAEVELHPTLGANMLAMALARDEVSWVRHHHERWDGSGYPAGLAGEVIPAGASIVAVAEAWDAMRSQGSTRVMPLSEGEAPAECRSNAGAQFAPWAVDALERAIAPAR